MFSFLKKKSEIVELATKWTYGFGVENIPDNKYLLAYSSVNPTDDAVTEFTKIPRIGDKIILQDDTYNDMIYSCIVTDVCYNYPLKWISISCDCKELLKSI